MEYTNLWISVFGLIASAGAWIWACRANRKASKLLDWLKQFNRAWYYHSIDPDHTKLVEDPASGMFLLGLEVEAEDNTNHYNDSVAAKQ